MQRTRPRVSLAPGLTLRRIAGGAALSGIGFTISLFIIDIAITEPAAPGPGAASASYSRRCRRSCSAGRSSGSPTGSARPNRWGSKLIRPSTPTDDHVRGNPDAPLTLVEYGDYECPFCSRATGSIDEVRAHFGDELRYVWRHLPLERVHPRAFDARQGQPRRPRLQGKYFEMGDELFDAPGRSGVVGHLPLRRRDRADIERFDDDVRVHPSKVLHRVQDDAQDAELMDLNSTPTFFVNGKRHKGPWDAASLIRALEASGP